MKAGGCSNVRGLPSVSQSQAPDYESVDPSADVEKPAFLAENFHEVFAKVLDGTSFILTLELQAVAGTGHT